MAGGKNVLTFNDANFEAEVLRSELPVLVDFTATWCGPCRLLAPIVEKLADELAGRVKVGKLDIDESPAIAARYRVTSVPTVVAFAGGEKKGQHTGLAPGGEKANRDRLVQLVGLG